MAFNIDDEFGGFEEAPSIITIPAKPDEFDSSKQSQIPDWLLTSQQQHHHNPAAAAQQHHSSSPNIIKQLQEELNQTKMQLLEQQAANIEIQSKHRQELHQLQTEFQHLLKQALAIQKENILKDFKHLMDQYTAEQDLRLKQKLRELNTKQEKEFGDKMDDKLVELQEKLLSHFQSDSEDLDVKIRKAVVACFRDEQLSERDRLKANMEHIEKNFKQETEKYVQSYFGRQSELFKEQIKSGMQQEHLIHKDLINNKLEKLFKASEEKRRMTNVLFTRHLSGLNFFVENAQKQLTILNQAHLDLIKNKEIVDYYGNSSSNISSNINSNLAAAAQLGLTDSMPLLSPTQSIANTSNSSSSSNNSSSNNGDDALLQDEDLLHDLS